jgi:hypothetical protein
MSDSEYAINGTTNKPVSLEFARVVWGSHILSYLNPYTKNLAGKHPQATSGVSGYDEVDSDEDNAWDSDTEMEGMTEDTDLLTPYDTKIREKFLNCVAELLSHSKGGATVTAAALREKEDSVEVDLSRNNGFEKHDDTYLTLLARYLAAEDIGK